ncbi:MAG: AlpA family phage regulatory protein [Proteobacteria bacterium]|nr:AlpA family phage regulatory protein [Pseudomonadota bacterium]
MEKLLRLSEVERVVGFKSSWIYRKVSENKFPRPLKIGRSSAWRSGDIAKWLQALGEFEA